MDKKENKNFKWMRCVKSTSKYSPLNVGKIYAVFSGGSYGDFSNKLRALSNRNLSEYSQDCFEDLTEEEIKIHEMDRLQINFDTMTDKLYYVLTNTGGWGGCNSEFVIANSPEDALIEMNSGFTGKDVSVREADITSLQIKNYHKYEGKYKLELKKID